MLSVTREVFILFALIAVGFVYAKLNLIKSDGVKQMTNLVFYVVTVCVVVNSLVSVKYDPEITKKLGIVCLFAVISHLICILVASILYKKEKLERKAVLKFSVIFSNCGFFSIPLVEALVGSEGVVYITAFIVIFNIMQWTYGIAIYRGKEHMSVKKALINPGTIGIAIGLPLYFAPIIFSNFTLPYIIASPLNSIASLNTPLAMIIIGFYLSTASIKYQKGDKALYFGVVTRLLVAPLIALFFIYLLAKPLGYYDDTIFITALMVPICAPPAASGMMFAAKFGMDTTLAARMMSIGTVCSIVTVPLVLMITKVIFT